jgi:hypothetical protein
VERIKVKVADEVWIGTALLQVKQPDRDFSVREIVDRVFEEGLHKPLRPGVQIHASQHCVANKRPNPGNYRMLYETSRGQRRLYRHTDEAHPHREGGKTVPARSDIPEEYWYLLDWYGTVYDDVNWG